MTVFRLVCNEPGCKGVTLRSWADHEEVTYPTLEEGWDACSEHMMTEHDIFPSEFTNRVQKEPLRQRCQHDQ